MRRRDVLAAAALAALVRPAPAAAVQVEAEPAVLADLIAREEAAALAHGLAGTGAADHEAAHAKALRTQLAALDRRAPPGARDAAELEGPARRLADERSTAAAIALEDELLAAYREALLRLAEPSILRTAATIMASHAQHRVLLSYPPL